jgi:hypothetical protein
MKKEETMKNIKIVKPKEKVTNSTEVQGKTGLYCLPSDSIIKNRSNSNAKQAR